MQLRPERLDAHLREKLAPLYVIHGDEPLLQIEAGDAIRAAARRAGCDDREVLVAESGFAWSALAAADQNLSLFGGRKLIDLRIPSGKPGVEGARALGAYAQRLGGDNVTLITLPRLERTTLTSEWFGALERKAVVIVTAAVDLAQMPGWMRARLARCGQRATPEALQRLVEFTEGNLLAAQQELDKLALLFPDRELGIEEVEAAVADVARYEVAQLSEAWLSGDAARVVRVLDGLQAEGESVQFVLWQLGEDVHALSVIAQAIAQGAPLAQALRDARVWGQRQAAMESAARRVDAARIRRALQALIRLDAISKGIGRGDVWAELRACGLLLAGASLPEAVHHTNPRRPPY
jgi:DNA polymerase-3 subunit delta